MTGSIEHLARLIETLTRKIAEIQSTTRQKDTFSDLSFRQIFYLEKIYELNHPTPTELVEALGLSKASISIAVGKLVEMGLLEKVPSPEDGRSYRLHLSAKGRRVAQVHDQVHLEIARVFAQGLTSAELETLLTLLDKVTARMNI